MSAITLETLATCLRPCIRAPHGKKLLVADLSAIENRVLAWLSGCEAMLDIYSKGLDPYKAFGVELFRVAYEMIDKPQRQICKPAVLGCGYGLGGGKEEEKYGQIVKTGLWGYAENMGVNISQGQAHEMVTVFRNAYPEVKFYWNYLEEAFVAAFKTRQRQQVGEIFFDATPEAVKILLPSGRCIHYLNPNAYYSQGMVKISFDGLRQKGWGRQGTWGGKLTENVVQAIARDVLAEGMLRAEQRGMTIVGHVHDELIAETPVMSDNTFTHHELEQAMADPIDWAPGLPLAAEGYTTEFYMKG